MGTQLESKRECTGSPMERLLKCMWNPLGIQKCCLMTSTPEATVSKCARNCMGVAVQHASQISLNRQFAKLHGPMHLHHRTANRGRGERQHRKHMSSRHEIRIHRDSWGNALGIQHGNPRICNGDPSGTLKTSNDQMGVQRECNWSN